MRVAFSFEPRRFAAYRYEMELVASHLRTAYSISSHREYLRSGYPSEPILAEAAARQLHTWRTLALESKEEVEGEESADPVVLILRNNLNCGFLDPDEIGGAVGRSLLLLARDLVVVDANALPSGSEPHFSRPIPVIAFIKALFPAAAAQKVLSSKPDNVARHADTLESKTFGEALKDAMLNFTHFAKWAGAADADDSAALDLDGDAAVGCFIRSMAAIMQDSSSRVHALIPVLLDRSALLSPEGMTGILVQFRRRRQRRKTRTKGTKVAYANANAMSEEDVGLFRPSEADACGGQTRLDRPYVTLVMELGVLPSDPQALSSQADAPQAPAFVDTSQPPERVSDSDSGAQTVQHPRYSVIAYGCSPAVYRVVQKRESAMYEQIFRKADGLAEHDGQHGGASLDLVRMLNFGENLVER